MSHINDSLIHLPRDLGGGLRLRFAAPADAEALAEMNATTLQDPTITEPDEGERQWTLDLMSGTHPTTGPGDFTVVEEAATGQLVSAMNLIPQTWRYEGVPFAVGRPEQVITRPEYRNRGLIRTQMETWHALAAQRGMPVLGITGIAGFYRQFGYEMALTLEGGRTAYAHSIPTGGEGANYRFRAATAEDADWMAETDARAGRRYAVSAARDGAHWRYEIAGKSVGNDTRLELRVIESSDGSALGYVGYGWRLFNQRLIIQTAELRPGAPWLPVAPELLRFLWSRGGEIAAGEAQRLDGVCFMLGPEHPLFTAAPGRLAHVDRPYAWYVRVSDLPAFVRHIAPALEARLAASVAAGWTGELKISFFRDGLRFRFDEGRLTQSAPMRPSQADPEDAGFPGLSFLQLLFGYRSLAELRQQYADCFAGGDEPAVLLDALFPKRPSNVWPVS